MSEYNLKAANDSFIKTAAYLVRSMHHDPDQIPSERLIDNWFRCTVDIIDQHKAAHKYIAEQRDEIARLKALLRSAEELLRVDPTMSDMTKYLGATLNMADKLREAAK